MRKNKVHSRDPLKSIDEGSSSQQAESDDVLDVNGDLLNV